AQAVARINSTADAVNGIRRINVARAVGTRATPTPTPTQAKQSTTPTPAATHRRTTPASTSPTHGTTPRSPVPSPRVLAVGPTTAPAPVVNAADTPLGGAETRTPYIAAAAVALLFVSGAAARLLTRRARRA
ncbi:MAG: hypothetical protein ACXVQS_11725, partial [Actinomycetota bacterium]